LGCNFIVAPCREQFSRRVTVQLYGNRPGLIPGSYRCLGVDFLVLQNRAKGLFRTLDRCLERSLFGCPDARLAG